MTSRLGFEVARLRATARIAADYLRSLLWPVCGNPEGWPRAAARMREGTLAEPLPPRFRVLSWNVHRGYRLDEVTSSLERILDRWRPDVLLLQEVPMYAERPFWESEGVRPLLAGWHLRFAPMHRVGAPSAYYPFQASGQLTASRAPISEWEVCPLPTVSRPKLGRRHRVQRVALGTAVAIRDGEAAMWNVHLENTTGPHGRLLQAARLLDRVQQRPRRPTILAGDFNTLFGGLEGTDGLLTGTGFDRVEVVDRRRLRPAIDHVFVRGLAALEGVELAARGSDHRPILVEVEVARQEGHGEE